MKTLWLLTWRGMKKRKAGTLLLGGAVALSAMFLTLVALVGLSSVKTAVENAKDTYGEQMVVATGMDAAAQSLLHNDAFLRKGAMLLSGSVTVENNAAAVLVGYADEAVRGMARIRLLDGRLPEAPGEIALERAAAFRLNAELGGTVTAAVTLADGRSETRTWKVTGLLQNYAAVWESYYRYAAGHFPEDVTIQPLNGLLCEQEAAALCALPYLYLLDAPRPDGAYIAAHIPADVLYVCNNTVHRELPSSGVGLPSEKETFLYVGIIAGAVLFTLASVLIGAFLLTVEKRRRQLALLRCVGATKSQARRILLLEALSVSLVGGAAGILVGGGLSYGAVQLFSALLGAPLLYAFSPWVPAAVLVGTVVFGLLVALIPALRAGRIPPVEAVAFRAKRRHPSRWRTRQFISPLRLSFQSLRRSGLRMTLTILGFAFCLVALNFVMAFCRTQRANTFVRPDFELIDRFVGSIGYGKMDGSIPQIDEPEQYVNTQRQLPEQVRGRLAGGRVYSKLDTLFCARLPKEKQTPYLLEYSDFWLNDDLTQTNPRANEKYGYDAADAFYRLSNLLTMDDALLEELEPYVTEGVIHPEALREGREVILCLPDYAYKITVNQDGTSTGRLYSSRFLSEKPPELKLFTNDAYHAGDDLELTVVNGTALKNGQSGAEARLDRTVKVGAVIRKPPDWLDMGGGEMMTLIAGEGAEERLGLPVRFSDLIVYLSGGEDYETAAAVMRTAAEKADLSLYDQLESNEAEETIYRLMLTVTAMLSVCIAAMGVMGLLNAAAGRVHSRRRDLSVLRSVGMTRGQELCMLVYEGVFSGVLAAILGTGGYLLLMACLTPENIGNTSWPLLIGGALTCILLSALAVLFPARQAMNVPPIEGIRQLD